MNFAERNAAWNGELREFRQMHTRRGVPRVWTVEVKGNQIITCAGDLGGSMQRFVETMQGINVGKKNAKTGEQYALERARYAAEKKYREGYREVALLANGVAMKADGTPVFLDTVQEKVIDFNNLPGPLRFYKPDNSMSAGMEKLAREGKVFYSRKRNGLAYVIAKGDGKAKLYSRTMLRQHDDEAGKTELTWDDRFPEIVAAADALMPPNSIMLGELVVDREGADDMAHIQSLTKSLTSESLQKQAHGKASFYIWDIAFWDALELVGKAPVQERYEMIHELDYSGLGNTLIPVQYFDETHFKTPEEAVEYAKKMGWEGFVVVAKDGVYGDKAFNFKGKPDRPGKACAKLKPTYEDDFIAIWDPEKKLKEVLTMGIPVVYDSAKNDTCGERSTKDRNAQGIKAVSLWQYNKKGELVYISNVSSGLTDEQKKNWADPALYPMVWKVEYKDRRYTAQGDDTNAMDFAAFVELRTDKRPEECVNPEL